MTTLTADTDTERRLAWIVDIDGTLALNNGGRSFYDETRVSEDDPCPVVTTLVSLLHNQGFDIVICSGRKDSCRTDTQNWLHQHNIPYTNLFMRRHDDNRKDAIVKLEILDRDILPNWEIFGVLDDRDQVVEAWRSRGLKVLQVAPGNF